MVPIERDDVECWLFGSQEEARALIRLAALDVFEAGPVGVQLGSPGRARRDPRSVNFPFIHAGTKT